MLTIYKVAPHTHPRRLKGNFESHVIRPPNKNRNAFYTQMLSGLSAVCAMPLFVYFIFLSRQQNACLGECCLGRGQFLEAQHASFLSSEESGILIILMKTFTCHQFHKNRK